MNRSHVSEEPLQIRRYRPGEERELWQLFHDTIHTVNAADYNSEQLAAWAPATIDFIRWQNRIIGMQPFVCVQAETIVGYTGWLDSGYIDHFYVHHTWQRQGVGTALMQRIHNEAASLQLTELYSDVSITARPFFETHGFQVITPQTVKIGDVTFKNFHMRKQL